MMHPHTELQFINETVGYGVVATRRIPKGTITWALDKLDRTFTESKVNKMPSLYRDILMKYTFRDKKGRHVLCWDISRYVNHSFRSNCISTAYDFELAIRDIEQGEELTDDYGYLNITEPFECLPEENIDRRVVYPDDLVRYHEQWDTQLKDAFKYFNQVEQPLASILHPRTLRKASMVAEDKKPMESILSCYYPGNFRLT